MNSSFQNEPRNSKSQLTPALVPYPEFQFHRKPEIRRRKPSPFPFYMEKTMLRRRKNQGEDEGSRTRKPFRISGEREVQLRRRIAY